MPVGFAHAYCTLEPDTEVIYKVTDFYAPECDRGLAFDDPDLGIAWPISTSEVILSQGPAPSPAARLACPLRLSRSVSRRPDQVLQNPAALMALLVAGQIVAWTLGASLTHRAPPLDVVESSMWGREWVIATLQEHPALPSWALEASRLLPPARSVGRPISSRRLFVAATFIFVFLLGRD